MELSKEEIKELLSKIEMTTTLLKDDIFKLDDGEVLFHLEKIWDYVDELIEVYQYD